MPYRDPKKAREWRNRNRQRMSESSSKCSARKRDRIMYLLGRKCSECGNDDFRVLDIDHRNGGGNKERVKVKGKSYYNLVIQNLDKYQILCANCNRIKKYECDENYRKYQRDSTAA